VRGSSSRGARESSRRARRRCPSGSRLHVEASRHHVGSRCFVDSLRPHDSRCRWSEGIEAERLALQCKRSMRERVLQRCPGTSVASAGVWCLQLDPPSVGGQLNTGCSRSVPCDRALLCISAPTGGLPGTCVVPLGAGSSCDCGACDPGRGGCDWNRGLLCIGGVCTPEATARPGESSCDDKMCVRSSICYPEYPGIPGGCVGGSADGERCYDSGPNAPTCVPPAQCMSGICVVPSAGACR
jgi:hypothetical protein